MSDHEKWLLNNKKAMGMVQNGLKDAKDGRVREIDYKFNSATKRAIKDARAGKGVVKCKDIDDLFKRLGIEKT